MLEGGSIDVNGAGAIADDGGVPFERCAGANPGLTREDMESHFWRSTWGSTRIWLRNGIAGDDTHGHVDDLARFTDTETIVIASEPDPADANYEPLQENLELLRETALPDVRRCRCRHRCFSTVRDCRRATPIFMSRTTGAGAGV